METPKFTGRNVPITEIAKATGKSQQFIRIGIQKRILNLDMPSNKKDPANTITSAQTKRYGRRPAILRI